jgi:hypothetical protein
MDRRGIALRQDHRQHPEPPGLPDARPEALRISIDTKAKVKVGEFSRGGEARGAEAPNAQDHDRNPEAQLVPFGILAVLAGVLTVVKGTSRETHDFIADGLQPWWDQTKERHGHIRPLVINLDNGPESLSRRTQFRKRLVEFADHNDLEIVLVYDPPYHSKYNPIERCWGIGEQHGNGTLLDSIATVLGWARSMTWKAIHPVMYLLDEPTRRAFVSPRRPSRPLPSASNALRHFPNTRSEFSRRLNDGVDY